MADREKVLTWLEICGKDRNCSGTCPYSEHGFGEYGECREQLMEDAFDLLKEDCHNCKLECLLQKYDELKEKYDELLKEQGMIEGTIEETRGEWPDETLPVSRNKEREYPCDHSRRNKA